jgi:hypothetical protein
LNTLVNFRPAQPSKTGQFSTGVNTNGVLSRYKDLSHSRHYNTAFKIDEAGYADILQQVLDGDFEK